MNQHIVLLGARYEDEEQAAGEGTQGLDDDAAVWLVSLSPEEVDWYFNRRRVPWGE
jgi:hypothetical protein